jgi:outer membrane protein TolC
VFPSGSDFRDDWSAGLSVQVPIFSGGKRRADVELARTQLRTTELQLAQLQESIQLDVAQQRGELQRAAALIRARSQTVSQAERVYSLTNLSYEMGLQTNLQLGDARLQLAQARGNEVQALHDYYVALARLLRAAGAPESEVVTRAIPGGGAR